MSEPRTFRKDVTDEELAWDMPELLAPLMARVVPCKVIRKRANATAATEEATAKSPSPSGTDLPSDEERAWLQFAYDHPNATNKQRMQDQALSSDKNNRIKNNVVANGYIEEFTVNLGPKTGGNVHLVILTQKACHLLCKPFHKVPRNCSLEHYWWQRNVCAFYRSLGFDSRVEYALNGKNADVGFVKNGKHVAIEIELTPTNALSNVRRCLEAGFSRILVACKNSRVKALIKKGIEQSTEYSGNQNVKVILLSEFSFVKDIIKS